MNSISFGETIRKLREEKGISLREMAASIDYDQSSLSKVERGEMIAPVRLVERMAKKLGTDYHKARIKYDSERIYYLIKGSDYALESIEIVKQRLEREGKGTTKKIKRESLLKKVKEYLSNQPIKKAWVFGSFARKEEGIDSDLDILVQFITPNKLDLLDFVGLKQDLETITGRKVDLVEEGTLLPNVKGAVEKEKVLIYEK